MQYKQDGDTYIIYVEQNEPIMETLTQFCKDHNIMNAQVSGIGAIKDIELGVYDLDNQVCRHDNVGGRKFPLS